MSHLMIHHTAEVAAHLGSFAGLADSQFAEKISGVGTAGAGNTEAGIEDLADRSSLVVEHTVADKLARAVHRVLVKRSHSLGLVSPHKELVVERKESR